MKRKFYLLAFVCAVAGMSVISSCKDNDEDYYDNLKSQIQNIKDDPHSAARDSIQDLAKKVEPMYLDMYTPFKNYKDANGGTVEDWITNTVLTSTEYTNTISDLKKMIQVQNITGITIQKVSSSAFGSFALPVGVKNNILASYSSSVTSSDKFPVQAGDNGLSDAELFGTAVKPYDLSAPEAPISLGKVYLTVNPISEDFEGMTPLLVNAAAQNGPVELTKLAPCADEMYFGYTRAASAVYVTEATVADPKEVALSFDLKNSAKEIKDAILGTPGVKASKVAGVIYDLVNQQSAGAVCRGIQLSSKELELSDASKMTSTVLSELSIAAATVQPLGTATVESMVGKFNLNRIKKYLDKITFSDNIAINAEINATANLTVNVTTEDGTTGSGTATGPVTGNVSDNVPVSVSVDPFKKARKYLNKIENYIDNIADAVAPAIVSSDAKGMQIMSVSSSNPTAIDADAKLIVSSYCAETLVPFAMKHVVITKVDGDVAAAEAVNAAVENLNKVVEGPAMLEIDLKEAGLKSGSTYEVAYSAMDYAGKAQIVRLYFTVR